MLEFSFRPVAPLDFAFCWPIYRDAMQPLIAELTQWNETSQRRGIEEALADDDASILVCEGADAGWLHVHLLRRLGGRLGRIGFDARGRPARR